MSSENEILELLRAGIAAAKDGDNSTAQKHLRRVVVLDDQNEMAWMWLATTADTEERRRACLEKVLEINPGNRRAQEALSRLGAVSASEEQNRQAVEQLRRMQTRREELNPPPQPQPQRRSSRGASPLLILLGVLGLLVVIVLLVFAFSSVSQQNAASSAQTEIAAATNIMLSASPTDTPGTPTETPFAGVIVTLDAQALESLPPTFTPTDSPTPLPTETPTVTPIPVSVYNIAYTGMEVGSLSPGLYGAAGDGSEENIIGSATLGFQQVAYSPSGQLVAFIREVEEAAPEAPTPPPASTPTDTPTPTPTVTPDPEAETEVNGADTLDLVELDEGDGATFVQPDPPVFDGPRPQLFIAPVDALDDAVQITNFAGLTMASPSWSPDGSRIVFMSDHEGNEELYTVNPDGSDLQRLTVNEAIDTDPAWSPVGDEIMYASDFDSPGFLQLYSIAPEGGEPTRITDSAGSSFDPAWSPDGSLVAFVSDRGGDGDIYTMEPDGQNFLLRTLDGLGAEDRSPVFSPDGRRVFFVSNREDEVFQVYYVDLEMGAEVINRVTNNDRNIMSVVFQPE